MGNNHRAISPRYSVILENRENQRRLRYQNKYGWNGQIPLQDQRPCPSFAQPVVPVIPCVPIGNPIPICPQLQPQPPGYNFQPQSYPQQPYYQSFPQPLSNLNSQYFPQQSFPPPMTQSF